MNSKLVALSLAILIIVYITNPLLSMASTHYINEPETIITDIIKPINNNINFIKFQSSRTIESTINLVDNISFNDSSIITPTIVTIDIREITPPQSSKPIVLNYTTQTITPTSLSLELEKHTQTITPTSLSLELEKHTEIIEPETPNGDDNEQDELSADITSHQPNTPTNIGINDIITISATIRNTGTIAHNFIVGYTIWDANANIVKNDYKYLEYDLAPTAEATVEFDVSFDKEGEYWLQFGVWKSPVFITENLLDKEPSPSEKLIRVEVDEPKDVESLKKELIQQLKLLKKYTITLNIDASVDSIADSFADTESTARQERLANFASHIRYNSRCIWHCIFLA